MPFHIVLVEPEIPANTGNIARSCAATGAHLHLVRPLGFQTDDKTLKRAGLDYWHAVNVHYHDSFAEVEQRFAGHHFYFASTRATKLYSDIRFQDGDLLVFGKETKGLPQGLIDKNLENCIRMPMTSDVRSLNLSNSAAIILYEALRQNSFPNLN